MVSFSTARLCKESTQSHKKYAIALIHSPQLLLRTNVSLTTRFPMSSFANMYRYSSFTGPAYRRGPRRIHIADGTSFPAHGDAEGDEAASLQYARKGKQIHRKLETQERTKCYPFV